ncbi:MAG: helix-turn-helix transcriptional regulator [Firmicutes bacterium]|nr:helix-turn-helix transcriptional regulator [Bacillota bacterium]
MFADNLKMQMENHGISQSRLSLLTGIGRSSISQYLSGKNMPAIERQIAIAKAVGCDLADLTITAENGPLKTERKVQRIDVSRAAKILGMNHETLRKGLQQGVFPWGYAIHTTDKRWSYFINAKKFADIEGVKVDAED